MADTPRSRSMILWAQVSGVAALQGAISLTWIAYNLYLPKFLGQLGFPEDFAGGVLIAESLLAIGMEPAFGALSDRAQRWLGSRFPFIAVGVVLSSALFLCLPAIALLGASSSVLRWGLPTVAIAWALAMTVFRSPSLALLGRYSPAGQLPKAASVLTLVGAVISAIVPQVNQFILGFGAGPTFAIGSIVLLVAATLLRVVDRRVAPPATDPLPPISIAPLALIFAIGVATSIGFGLVKSLLTLREVTGVFTIANIFLAVPAGLWAVKLGNRRAMVGGIAAMVLLLGLLGLIPTPALAVATAVLLSGALCLVANGLLPLALTMFPAPRAGLAVGIYLGGTALASSLSNIMKLATQPPLLVSIVATIALISAALCVNFHTRTASQRPVA